MATYRHHRKLPKMQSFWWWNFISINFSIIWQNRPRTYCIAFILIWCGVGIIAEGKHFRLWLRICLKYRFAETPSSNCSWNTFSNYELCSPLLMHNRLKVWVDETNFSFTSSFINNETPRGYYVKWNKSTQG